MYIIVIYCSNQSFNKSCMRVNLSLVIFELVRENMPVRGLGVDKQHWESCVEKLAG